MNARDAILSSIRANRPAGTHDLPTSTHYVVPGSDDPVALFTRSLKQMGGQMLDRIEEVGLNGIVCSTAPEVTGNRDLNRVGAPQDLQDVDVAVVRAVCGIAETGSVLFTEAELQVNALAYLAQHLVVLLDPADILPSIQDAYRRSEFSQAAYAVFHTGPSATADIEGVLIHGAQGVRSLTVVLLARPSGPNRKELI